MSTRAVWWPRLRPVLYGLLGLLALAAVWEFYKAVAPDAGVTMGSDGVIILPRADDRFLPHVWEIFTQFGEPVVRIRPDDTYFDAVWSASLYTLRIAAYGWALGVVVGLGLAVVMSRFRIAEAGILPWVIASQTVPLIALAPVLSGWSRYIHVGSWTWGVEQTMTVIAAYLAFFPISVGALRGLKSPEAHQLELMHVYGVGWWRTLVKLRLPASVPYLLPALRLGATSAVVGAVVAETSVAQGDGIGKLIMYYSQNATTNPAKPWMAIMGAIAIGLLAAGAVALLGLALRRYTRGESS